MVLRAEFPEVPAYGAGATVGPVDMFSQVFTNGSPATMTDYFKMKTTLIDTHEYAFEVILLTLVRKGIYR